jgi:hypothetical protein
VARCGQILAAKVVVTWHDTNTVWAKIGWGSDGQGVVDQFVCTNIC